MKNLLAILSYHVTWLYTALLLRLDFNKDVQAKMIQMTNSIMKVATLARSFKVVSRMVRYDVGIIQVLDLRDPCSEFVLTLLHCEKVKSVLTPRILFIHYARPRS